MSASLDLLAFTFLLLVDGISKVSSKVRLELVLIVINDNGFNVNSNGCGLQYQSCVSLHKNIRKYMYVVCMTTHNLVVIC